MASARPGFGLPSNPRDTMRTRRYGSATDPADVSPTDIRQQVRQYREMTRNPNEQPSQGKTATATGQPARPRRPSIPVSSSLSSTQIPRVPTFDVYNGGPPATTSDHYTLTASGPSSSTKHQDTISIPTRSILRKKLPITTYSRGGTVFHSRDDSERTASSSSSVEPPLGPQIDRVTTQSPAEIRVAQTVELPRTQAHAITIYPELDRYRNLPSRPIGPAESDYEVPFRLATHDLPPPTPAFSGTSSQLSAGSPSTRFSESPGPGSYSRDTTPTSMSSQSPGLLASMRFTPHQKPRQVSPALSRPPVTRRRTGSTSNDAEASGGDVQGLAAVREALTSSSSSSTVRDGDRPDREKLKKKKKQLSPLPPSPPPRKSSQKFRDDQGKIESSPGRSRDTTGATSSPPKASTSRTRPALTSRATPPSRPSRDDTPDLHSQLFGPPPIVHSNLTSVPAIGDRPGTTERNPSYSAFPRRTTPSPSLSKPERFASPQSGREATPKPRPTPESPVGSPDKNLKTAHASAFNTRFPFFGKRSKTAPNLGQADEKPVRKGPVAGTGHEGYGRIGSIRRRSGSLLIGRSKPDSESPQTGLIGNQSVDTFLQDRISPVVISGGEIVHNRNISSDLSHTDSNQSFAMSRPSIESRWDSETSTTSSFHRDPKRVSSLPRVTKPRVSNRRPFDSSDSEALAMKTTLAFRRSIHRRRSSPDQEPLRLPKPINTSRGASPSINSKDTSVRTDDSVLDEWEASRGRKATATPPRKLTKTARSPRKWNPFSRSQSRPKKTEEPEPVSATVQVVQQPQMPFYAIMDGSEQEDMEPQNIEDVLRDAHVFDAPLDIPTPPPLSVRHKLPSEPPERPLPGPRQQRQLRRMDKTIVDTSQVISPPVASPPVASPPVASPPVGLPPVGLPPVGLPPVASPPAVSPQAVSPQDFVADAAQSQPRPSRLPQVGRIPKVVNTRVEPASPRSFSRPFNRLSYQRLTPVDALEEDFIAKGPSPQKPSTPELTPETSSGETASGSNSHATPPDLTGREFLALSPNKRYQGHTSSSSSGSNNYGFAYELAVIPDTNGPLVEDEIWEEYNDLIGDVPPSATSSKGTPFHLETYGKTLVKKNQVLESPTIAQSASKNILTSPELDDECVTESESECSNHSGDMTERIRKAFAPKPELKKMIQSSPRAPRSAPRTPRVNDTVSVKSPARTPKIGGEIKVKSPIVSQHRVSDVSSKSRKSDSSCKSSEDESPLAQVNLRVGSMTVSKWLSFGHVLFSPAREELVPDEGSLKRHSILVIDGLGNDDWSFYAAETYPTATFFNMSPRAPLPANRQTISNFPLSPPNHHQIQFISHLDKFPFSPESFTSVVYRFPAAAPESHYRNIVSEARRVLKPGGYIELSILDVDLNNMGNRGRRAIRQLKERLRETTPDTSLGSSSDLVVRLLGNNGFSDIKTCHVGVPVASAVTKPNTALVKDSDKGFKRAKEQRSLADMMNDKSDSADENITKMVAKVGRWWYTRCYESAARGSPASKGIWTDRALLAECEELGTSLKLMVCYARVPERSRIASI